MDLNLSELEIFEDCTEDKEKSSDDKRWRVLTSPCAFGQQCTLGNSASVVLVSSERKLDSDVDQGSNLDMITSKVNKLKQKLSFKSSKCNNSFGVSATSQTPLRATDIMDSMPRSKSDNSPDPLLQLNKIRDAEIFCSQITCKPNKSSYNNEN